MSDIKEFLSVLQKTNPERTNVIHSEEIIPFAKEVKELLLIDFLHPEFDEEEVKKRYLKVEKDLSFLLAKDDVEKFMNSLPEIRELLIGSAQAIYDGDPASTSIAEIVITYPGFQAISAYRIAHLLYQMKYYLFSRIISEYAHHLYGIDINPGATIGKRFFIDHGTGIVIGETAVIGDNVKLYQGVTLGALSLKKGHDLQGVKRHPTVLDDVTIYSNASIFGGDTIIGSQTTIGANTYITKSVPNNTIVYLNEQGMTTQKKDYTK